MNRYEFTETAQSDLMEIHDYIAADNVEAARNWVDHIEQSCQTIAELPGMGRSREDLEPGLHSFPVGNYLIFYRTVTVGIQFVRVLHGARDIGMLF